MESSMFGVQAGVTTPAPASAAVVGACTPNGMVAVLLPGIGAPTTRLRAVADASTPRPRGTHVFLERQDTPQKHNLQKFAYINGTAAANGDATGLQQAWDPV